jgi:hypothetical protein
VAHFYPEDGDSSRFLGLSKTLVTSYQAAHWHNPRDHIWIISFYFLISCCH